MKQLEATPDHTPPPRLAYSMRETSEILGLSYMTVWNVQTEEVVFNEVWAQIVGYTLDELAPI